MSDNGDPTPGVNLGPVPEEGFKFVPRIDEDPGAQILRIFKLTDWTEPWLIGLMAFHVSLMALNLKFRQNGLVQGILFVSLLLLVYFSEFLNQVAANNWRKFAGQQYFDSSGLFISVVFSIPALFNCMVVVGNWLYQSSLLMVQVKQAQLKRQLQQERDAFAEGSKPRDGPAVGRRRRKRASVDGELDSKDDAEEPQLRRSARMRNRAAESD